MCSALQMPLKSRFVFPLLAIFFLTFFQSEPAHSRSILDSDSSLSATETVNQVVSPSGYRYDTSQGNPYATPANSGASSPHSYVPKTPSAHTTSYYPPNQFSASNNPYNVPSGCLPTIPNPSSSASTSSTNTPFPQYVAPAGRYGALPFSLGITHASTLPSSSYTSSFRRLSPAELHEKIIWSAATTEEEAMLSRVQHQQLNNGPSDPGTLQNLWETANFFADEQKANLAEPLLKELIVTIESHPNDTSNAGLLSMAKAKLSILQSVDMRVSSTPVIDPSTVYVARPYSPMSYASGYGSSGSGFSYGGYGGYGGYNHYHSYHGHSFHYHYSGHSGGGHARIR